MIKNSMLAALGILMIGLIGCEMKTPEIRGVVLDAETKQPVEGAWITATIGIKTKTIAGDVNAYLSVEPPHTRTDKAGKFVIPPRHFQKPSFPKAFGTELVSFGIGASTVDDRGGSVDLKASWGKNKVETTILIKPDHVRDTEGEYFVYLQGLFKYCLTGRFTVEVPAVEGGCDDWEFKYAITKHERYVDKNRKLAEEGKAKGYSVALEQLSELYEKKGDLNMAIEPLKKKIGLMEKRGLLRFQDWQRDKEAIEWKIKKLQERARQKQK